MNVVLTKMSQAAVLDLFPWAKRLPPWFPGAWFIRYANGESHVRVMECYAQPALEKRHLIEEMGTKPFVQVEQELVSPPAHAECIILHGIHCETGRPPVQRSRLSYQCTSRSSNGRMHATTSQ